MCPTYLAQVAGCESELTAEEVEEGNVDTLALQLANQVKEQGLVLDPLHAKQYRAFREHYCELWDAVTSEAHQQERLFDDYLLDKAQHLVTALSWWA